MERIGGHIERGKILAASEEGYRIASLDREGIETPPLEAADGKAYLEGDKVYFFYFPDGTGKILCGL